MKKGMTPVPSTVSLKCGLAAALSPTTAAAMTASASTAPRARRSGLASRSRRPPITEPVWDPHERRGLDVMDLVPVHEPDETRAIAFLYCDRIPRGLLSCTHGDDRVHETPEHTETPHDSPPQTAETLPEAVETSNAGAALAERTVADASGTVSLPSGTSSFARNAAIAATTRSFE